MVFPSPPCSTGGPGGSRQISTALSPPLGLSMTKRKRSLTGLSSEPSLDWRRRQMRAWRSTSTALWPCARMSVVSLCGKRMVSGNCMACEGVMVSPCRRDPTALMEQESKGGASETAGSSKMPGRLWACSSHTFLAALSPPFSASPAQREGRAAPWTAAPALTDLLEFSQGITTNFIQDSNLCI